MKYCVLLTSVVVAVGGSLEDLAHLPTNHLPYFFTNNPHWKELCQQSDDCPYKDLLPAEKCWGYEDDCPKEQRMYQLTSCPEDATGWVISKAQQEDMFWNLADFGYIRQKKSELKPFCEPYTGNSAQLECSAQTHVCRGRNVYFDFTTSRIKESLFGYREDLFTEGQLGAYCKFNKTRFYQEGEKHTNALRDWFGELQHFRGLGYDPFDENKCDVILDKPTYFVKLDSGFNMYHRFCDFVNLYMTQHLNNSFSKDVNIVMWQTVRKEKYLDIFRETFQVFSSHPVIHLAEFDKKKLCVRDAVFSLLPRTQHFYNMLLIPGCERSSMYKAFSQHVTHGLHITQHTPLKDKVRVTFLSRAADYRNVLNENQHFTSN